MGQPGALKSIERQFADCGSCVRSPPRRHLRIQGVAGFVVVSDIGSREIRDMLARTSPLAVVASLAPLLGLLGTMIGMIETFELVSIYGDDGGASMLAGSIAKALITTAVGLMIAIPAIAAYQYIKHRINHPTNALETDTEAIISHLYLKKSTATEGSVA